MMENPIKIGDLGVPLFLETPSWKWFDGVSRAEKLVRIVSLCHARLEVLCIYNPGHSFRYRGSSCNFLKKNDERLFQTWGGLKPTIRVYKWQRCRLDDSNIFTNMKFLL